MNKKSLLSKLFAGVFLLCFSITVYIPQLIYFAQKEYFNHPFFELVYKPFLLGCICCIGLLALCSLFTAKVLKYISAFFLLLAFLVWLQADLFSISYGVIDGMEIDFIHYNARGNVELLLFFFGLIAVMFFNKGINRVKYRMIYGFWDPWVRSNVLKQALENTDGVDNIVAKAQNESDGRTSHFMHEKMVSKALNTW